MQEFIQFARELATESGALIMRYFNATREGRGPDIISKADDSPVTAADREAEALMRAMIEKRFPQHTVVGEEGGTSGGSGGLRWVLDPIDGTRSFVHGVPLFGTLIALLEGDEPILGVIHLPATGELMLGAKGEPTTVNGRPVRVRETSSLSQATILYTDGANMARRGFGDAWNRLESQVALTRGWGDCYGHFMVAAGRADLMFDPVLALWDVAALKPCILGAGGDFSDIGGNREGLGNSALSSNGRLHAAALEALKG